MVDARVFFGVLDGVEQFALKGGRVLAEIVPQADESAPRGAVEGGSEALGAARGFVEVRYERLPLLAGLPFERVSVNTISCHVYSSNNMPIITKIPAFIHCTLSL